MLRRRHARRAVTEAADWREVSAQLATLQTEMARLTATLTEDRKQRQPSRWAWLLALGVFFVSASLVSVGISMSLLASTTAATASTYRTLAREDMARSAQILQPLLSLANRKGAAWVLDHANKASVSETNLALRWAKRYDSDSASATASQDSANGLELTAPALLTFGSALAGAMLGWMLTQWLTSYSRRNAGAAGEPTQLVINAGRR